MNKMKILLILIIILSTAGLYGQENNAESQTETDKTGYLDVRYAHQIGMSYSNISGGGFHYLLTFGDYYGIKLAGIYIYDKDTENDIYTSEELESVDTDANAGIEFQRDIIQKFVNNNISMRLYFLLGGSFWYAKDVINFKDTGNLKEITREDKYISAGIALGYEIQFWQSVVLNVNFGYAYSHFIKPENEKRYAGFGGGVGAGIIF